MLGKDSISQKWFVRGGGHRIFNNNLTPCEPIQGAQLFCGTTLVSRASIQPGRANGRTTFDFCGPREDGAPSIDAACAGQRITVEVTKPNGRAFCYSPPGANGTYRNGKFVPNRAR